MSQEQLDPHPSPPTSSDLYFARYPNLTGDPIEEIKALDPLVNPYKAVEDLFLNGHLSLGVQSRLERLAHTRQDTLSPEAAFWRDIVAAGEREHRHNNVVGAQPERKTSQRLSRSLHPERRSITNE